jgi:hypothetical protein
MEQNNGQYSDYSFIIPRKPSIRIWGASDVYKDGLYVSAVDDPGGCFAFTSGIKIPLVFQKDESGNLTTATTGDFIFDGLANGKSVEGWMYIAEGSPGTPSDPKYTLYVYSDGDKGIAGTKFGKYQGPKKQPTTFPDGSNDYFVEMTDGLGDWLWLYRLYEQK